jgi:hypothetical protein
VVVAYFKALFQPFNERPEENHEIFTRIWLLWPEILTLHFPNTMQEVWPPYSNTRLTTTEGRGCDTDWLAGW